MSDLSNEQELPSLFVIVQLKDGEVKLYNGHLFKHPYAQGNRPRTYKTKRMAQKVANEYMERYSEAVEIAKKYGKETKAIDPGELSVVEYVVKSIL